MISLAKKSSATSRLTVPVTATQDSPAVLTQCQSEHVAAAGGAAGGVIGSRKPADRR